jgi:hypothetical protein
MTTDEPDPAEIVTGVKNRLDISDIGFIAALILGATGWALYQGIEAWWVYPVILSGVFFGIESAFWYYNDYRDQLLETKAERLADGEDIDPEIDTGPGITSPYGITLIGSITVWGLITNYLIHPIFGSIRGGLIFFGGMFLLIIGTTHYFQRTSRID